MKVNVFNLAAACQAVNLNCKSAGMEGKCSPLSGFWNRIWFLDLELESIRFQLSESTSLELLSNATDISRSLTSPSSAQDYISAWMMCWLCDLWEHVIAHIEQPFFLETQCVSCIFLPVDFKSFWNLNFKQSTDLTFQMHWFIIHYFPAQHLARLLSSGFSCCGMTPS